MHLVSDCVFADLANLVDDYSLQLHLIDDATEIPGSFWGDSEAGLIQSNVYVRKDTPVHSFLHEASHALCMSRERLEQLHTDAGGDFEEENAVCYLQILLADRIPGFSSQQCMQDMDEWGYTFRLGSARSWFEQDAQDAFNWLKSARPDILEKIPS